MDLGIRLTNLHAKHPLPNRALSSDAVKSLTLTTGKGSVYAHKRMFKDTSVRHSNVLSSLKFTSWSHQKALDTVFLPSLESCMIALKMHFSTPENRKETVTDTAALLQKVY